MCTIQMVSTTPWALKAAFLQMAPSRQDMHHKAKGGSEEPLVAQVQFMGQLVVMSS